MSRIESMLDMSLREVFEHLHALNEAVRAANDLGRRNAALFHELVRLQKGGGASGAGGVAVAHAVAIGFDRGKVKKTRVRRRNPALSSV